MLGFCLVVPIADAMAKLAGETVPLVMLMLARFGSQGVILTVFALATSRPLTPAPGLWPKLVLRASLLIAGLGTMYAAFQYMPLADAIAIAFVFPFFMLGLGWLLLGEEVGPHRLFAALIGFCGALLVIQPSFAAVGAPALLPLAAAISYTFFILLTRNMAQQIDPISLQAITGGLALLALGLVVALLQGQGGIFALAMPTAGEFWLLTGIGILGTVSHLLMTWAIRLAPAATLAPMQYLEIPVTVFVGWAVFGDLPNGVAAIGILVTVCAGLYVIWREQLAARRIAVST